MTWNRLSWTAAAGSILIVVSAGLLAPAFDSTGSSAEESSRAKATCEVAIEATDDRDRPLPIRVIVTSSDGSHPDGSAHGAYGDGRFFADGKCTVRVPPGETKVALSSGPNYVPAEVTVTAVEGKLVRAAAKLRRWFAPEEKGWYGGDNHVHAQHERPPADGVQADLAYTALQGQANGLSFICEAGSGGVDYARATKLDTDRFLLRTAEEQRLGPFVGHFNTPGIRGPIPAERYNDAVRGPLPAQAVRDLTHDLGGAFIYTHLLVPIHQLHWMGAAESLSDAVLGQTADLMDLDGAATERLWYTALNLGNRLGCSGSTDAALTRSQTPSPGDRRVYARAKEFTFPAIVEALRSGRTFATNGGPVFPFLTVAGREPGETIPLPTHGPLTAQIEVRALYPLRKVELIRRGLVAHTLQASGKTATFEQKVRIEEIAPGDWFVLRVEDERGNWGITSPIYVGAPTATPTDSHALLLEIGNFTRYVELRREFFAHLVVTVAQSSALDRVEIVRDGRVARTFRPADKNQVVGGKAPVTGLRGDYAEGWMWANRGERAVHLQADWPVADGGWYHLRATTTDGHRFESDAIHFDPKAEVSRAISVAHLAGGGTSFRLHGYGEDMKLADIRVPFAGDHWWYPHNTYCQVRTKAGGKEDELKGGKNMAAADLFRPAVQR